MIKPLDDIIARGNFMGAENTVPETSSDVGLNVAPGLGFGVAPGVNLMKEILDDYERSSF